MAMDPSQSSMDSRVKMKLPEPEISLVFSNEKNVTTMGPDEYVNAMKNGDWTNILWESNFKKSTTFRSMMFPYCQPVMVHCRKCQWNGKLCEWVAISWVFPPAHPNGRPRLNMKQVKRWWYLSQNILSLVRIPNVTSLCLRTENRARKTHIFEKRNFRGFVGVGWGGGGHVNAPCTSYSICCYAAEIPGIVATWHDSTLLMGWGGGGAC